MMFEFGQEKNLISFERLAIIQKMRKNVWVSRFEISHTSVRLGLPSQINVTNYQSIHFKIHPIIYFHSYYLRSN